MMFFDEFPEQPHSTSDPFRWFLEQTHHGWATQIQASTGWNYITCKLMVRQLADAAWRGPARQNARLYEVLSMSHNVDCET